MKRLLSILVLIFTISCSTKYKTRSIPFRTITLNTYNHIVLNDINKENCNKAMNGLKSLIKKRDKKKYPIYLVLDSGGGDVKAMKYMTNELKHYDIKTVSLYAASAAHMIVQLNPGERLISFDGTMMIHDIKVKYDFLEPLPLQMIINYIKGNQQQNLKIWKQISKRTKTPLNKLLSLLKYEQYYVGDKAVMEGHADAVVEIYCSKKLRESIETTTHTDFFGSNTVTKRSKCPILR